MSYSNDKRVLQKVFNIAKHNGYKNLLFLKIELTKEYIISKQYYQIIYDPAFAKAFWGELDHYRGKITCFSLPQWIWKIRKMVVCDDPIAFLEEEAKSESKRVPSMQCDTSTPVHREDKEGGEVDPDFPLPEML